MKIPENVEPTVIGALVALMEVTREHFLDTAPKEERLERFRLAYENAESAARQVSAHDAVD